MPVSRQREELRSYCSHPGETWQQLGQRRREGKKWRGARHSRGKKAGPAESCRVMQSEKEMSREIKGFWPWDLTFGGASNGHKGQRKRDGDTRTSWISGTTNAKWKCQVKQLNKWVWGPKKEKTKSLILSVGMVITGAQGWDCLRVR